VSINIVPSQTENISTSGAISDAFINENEINNESNDNTIQNIIEIQDITEVPDKIKVQDITENNFDKILHGLKSPGIFNESKRFLGKVIFILQHSCLRGRYTWYSDFPTFRCPFCSTKCPSL